MISTKNSPALIAGKPDRAPDFSKNLKSEVNMAEKKKPVITATRPFKYDGEFVEIGTVLKDVDEHFASEMISAKKAVAGEAKEVKKQHEAAQKKETAPEK